MQTPLKLTRAGIAGTLVAFLVAAICVRLGFWQLDRLEQRRARNAAAAERMAHAPVMLGDAPADTSGLLFRRFELRGEYEQGSALILRGQSRRGAPGVHLLVYLRPRQGRSALLVDRGWLPSPDAATVDLAPYLRNGTVRLLALALPVPRKRWERALARPPHATRDLPDVYFQALPADGPPSLPAPTPLPELDDGPHLSYAVQWFGFALIALVGWLVLALRR